MHRRSFLASAVVAAAVTSVMALDALAVGPASAVARVRSRGRTPTPRRPRAPVPSYMRADSKPRGRFGP